jgi:hypothetical protein
MTAGEDQITFDKGKETELLTYHNSVTAIWPAVIASGVHAPYTLHPPTLNQLPF